MLNIFIHKMGNRKMKRRGSKMKTVDCFRKKSVEKSNRKRCVLIRYFFILWCLSFRVNDNASISMSKSSYFRMSNKYFS